MFQLTTLKLEDISLLLMDVFNTYCVISGVGKYIPKYTASPLNKKWIADVWKMINHYKNLTHINLTTNMAIFDNIPLIPILTADDTSIKHFYTLKGDYILKEYKGTGFRMHKPLPVDIIVMLEAENIKILKSNSIIEDAKIIGSYVKYPTDGGILELCEQRSSLKEKYVAYVGTGNMWQPTNIDAVPFGQREELVTRLKGILQSYTKQHSVLKEILQNADDAGATEVHFLYDMRHHQTKFIFNDKWKPLQGPSLIVFNDACFTANDLEGIKNLGIGSKTEDATKTGQFGIGFNAVYHITDVPTFMSRGDHSALEGTYCVLDPHCQYAPLSKFDAPGMLMKLQKLKEGYPDVFDTFLSARELKREHGTWFRFPLRNVEMARKSEIRKTPFTSNDMERLINEMSCDMEESLLFLLNIKRITLSRVNQIGTHDILNRVDLVDSEDMHMTHINFKTRFKEYNDLIKQPILNIESFVLEEFRYFHKIENFKTKESSTWLAVQTLGFSEPEMIDRRLASRLKEKEISIIPRGGVAIRIWPTSCTNKFKSKAFCLLPLNIETGLTGHVNGSFCVDMSRNRLWGSDVDFSSDVRSIWNLELIRSNIAFAYASCIDYTTELGFILNRENSYYDIQQYFKFLPDFNEAKNDFWKELIYHFFLHSKERRLEIFPISPSFSSRGDIESNMNEKYEIPTWTCLHLKGELPILIDDLSDQIEPEDACSLRKIFVELGMKLTCSPRFVKESALHACKFIHTKYTKQHVCGYFADAQTCICIESISPKATLDFFKSYKLDIQGKFEIQKFNVSEQVNQIKQVLKYCLKEMKWDILCGAPLLISQIENIYEIKERNDFILSEFYYLLQRSPEKFVHESLVDILRIYKKHFKVLSIRNFAELLPKTLESSIYKLDSPRLMVESLSRQWLIGFWEYIDSEAMTPTDLFPWCLLPVTWKSTEFLFPIKLCSLTIDINSFNTYPELLSVLSAMCLPVSNIESKVLQNLQANYRDIETTLTCLHYWKDHKKCDFKLTKKQCLVVLSYLIKGIHSNEKEKIRKFTNLPLFPTLYGETVSVTGKKILILDNCTIK